MPEKLYRLTIQFRCPHCGLHAQGNLSMNQIADDFFSAAWSAHVDKCRAKVPRPVGGEPFRDGVPALALRLVHAEWENDCFVNSAYQVETFHEVGTPHEYVDAPGWPDALDIAILGKHSTARYRPHNATWAEVELRAAQLLGKRDAESGEPKRDVIALWTALGCPSPGCDCGGKYEAAYLRAYEAVKRPTAFRVGNSAGQGGVILVEGETCTST